MAVVNSRDVDVLAARHLRLGLLTPDRQCRGSAHDEALSFGRITTKISGELGEDVPIAPRQDRSAIHLREEQGATVAHAAASVRLRCDYVGARLGQVQIFSLLRPMLP